MFKRMLIGVIVLSVALSGTGFITWAQDEETQLINHRGQNLFLSGINLAWISFARDLIDFDERTWVAIMDDSTSPQGNSVRWRLHTDGSPSPIYGDDGKVIGRGENDIANLKRAEVRPCHCLSPTTGTSHNRPRLGLNVKTKYYICKQGKNGLNTLCDLTRLENQ